MTGDLFGELETADGPRVLAEGAVVLHGFARILAPACLAAVDEIATVAPFRHMLTPGGFVMSVAMSNCGVLGWVSDASGYRYSRLDPASGRPWPAMPEVFSRLASDAAAAAGFADFAPDACLINRYEAGAKLSLHKDLDEGDLAAPIVSVSLGWPAIFLFGGLKRRDPTVRIALTQGDVVVWGGPSRLRYHGVLPVKQGSDSTGLNCRINLSFRKAGPAGAMPAYGTGN